MSKLHGISESFPLHPPLCREKETAPRVAWSLGFLFQTLLFTSSARELPAVNWEKNTPLLPRHPDTPNLAAALLYSKEATHLQTSFHDHYASPSAEAWLLVGAGEPPTKITTILPGGMSGNFPETPSQIPSAGITKLTTPELQSPVTAQLKHFLYTFSARLPLPPSPGSVNKSSPREARMGLGGAAISPAAN